MTSTTEASPKTIRRSRATKWRVIVLVGIHLAFLVHLWHLNTTGSSISPLEPSEGMELASKTIVNAGLIFFGLTIVGTLLFGRFFCGWGCHVLALQDLCLALLTKLGIKPRPLRSRALLIVPIAAAIWMFVYPLYVRWTQPEGIVVNGVELTTNQFWETFPGPLVAILTFLICGFAIVYFLGSKGFCTYACPYGAIFGAVDKLAPVRIRVSDACEGCGHCTATCTSNVAVAQEVRDYGMVVDAGCMKCMDCVSVCPTNALSLGLGKPALFAKPRVEEPKPRKPRFAWGTELLLLGVFGLSFFCVYHVWILHHERVPFLMSLGIAGVATALFHTGFSLISRSKVSLQNLELKRQDQLTGTGRVFACSLVPLAAFFGYLGVLRVLEIRAESTIQALEPWTARYFAPPSEQIAPNEEFERLVEELEQRTDQVRSTAMIEGEANGWRRVWLHLLKGELDTAQALADELWRKHPEHVDGALLAFDVSYVTGQKDAAIEALESVVEHAPERHFDLVRLVPLLVEAGRAEEALVHIESALEHSPDVAQFHLQHVRVSSVLRRNHAVEEHLNEAIRLEPEMYAPHLMLMEYLQFEGRQEEAQAAGAEALEILRRGKAATPDDPALLMELVQHSLRMGTLDGVEETLNEIVVLTPTSVEPRAMLVRLLIQQQRFEEARGVLDEPGFENDPTMQNLRAQVPVR